MPRFVTKEIHAYLDYPVAFALIGLPFLIGLGGSNSLALHISPIVGIAALVLTIFTNHHLGLFRVLPYRFHMAVDAAVGVLFLLLPFMLGFKGIDAFYYWANGAAVVAVISLSKPEGITQAA